MTKFAIVTAILSMVLMGGFVGLSVWRFRLLGSYSRYARKWTELVPMHNVNVWSIVTVAVAILLMPAMIERAQGDMLQCFGFLAPCYLIAVAMTPRYETEGEQMIWHGLLAICCAVGFLAYVCFGLRLWFVPLITAAAFAVIALLTKSLKSSYLFWGEMAMFAAAYVVVLIPGT